jgi:hypothetical protein
VARASHEHALFRDVNASVYHCLEKRRDRKDGRGAWLALLGQYSCNDKWEVAIKIQEAVLQTRTWKGQNNDTGLQAAIASESTVDGPIGMRNDFEAAATHLLPYDPVAKKRLKETKRWKLE